MGLDPEQCGEPLPRAVGEQVVAGVQGLAGAVGRVVLATAGPCRSCWTRRRQRSRASPARRTTGGTSACGEGTGPSPRPRRAALRCGLEARESWGHPPLAGDHGDDLTTFAPGLRPLREPGLERLLGAAFDRIQQPRGPGPVADRNEVDDQLDSPLSPRRVWARQVGPAWGAARGDRRRW